MWELDLKEGWTLKNWCWRIWCWRRFESPLFCKIKPVNPKGNQSWIFIGRTDAEIETPVLWLPDATPLIRKDPDAGKIEGKRRRIWQRMRWLDGITNSWTWVWESPGRWWRPGTPGMLQSMGSQGVGYDWAVEYEQLVEEIVFFPLYIFASFVKDKVSVDV